MKRKNLLTLFFVLIISGAGLYYYLNLQNNEQITNPPPIQITQPQGYQEAEVIKVIDGDTIKINSGEHIRYIGIDTPEIDQRFYQEAKDRNQELVGGKKIKVIVCKSEPRDKYGRLLAWIYVNDIFVNASLLKEGYARILTIPPCGNEKEDEFKNYEKEAKDKGLGLWATGGKLTEQNEEPIPAETAARYIGKTKTVRGKVIDVFDSGRAIFLNFGKDYKKDFTVVIFRKNINEFEKTGIDPLKFYKDKEVLVTGKIKEYNGPEIVANNPSQIEVR